MRKRSSLTLFELLAASCVILVLVGIFAVYAEAVLKTARSTALQNELVALRMSVEHYRIIYGRPPADLGTLVNKYFTTKDKDGIIQQNKLLGQARLDRKGNLRDPFLSPYHYEQRDGRVWSGTKGYENW